MVDIGLTHAALPVTDLKRSLVFHAAYTGLRVIHQRGEAPGRRVAWISDGTRPFVVGCATPELLQAPRDDGPPVGTWAFLRDPDGHTPELSFGQEIGLWTSEAGA